MAIGLNASDFTKGKHLKAADVTKPFVDTIVDVKAEDFDDKAKLVLTLAGQNQGVVLNKGNTLALQEGFGDKCADWIGKDVRVSRAKVSFGGNRVYGVVVQPGDDAS